MERYIIIDAGCDMLYASFYIQGLTQVFGSRRIRFGRLGVNARGSGCLNFMVCDGAATRKVTISMADSYQVDPELYHWCDVYGSVNANFSKTPEQYHGKLVALCPSFGIRLDNVQKALLPSLLASYSSLPLKKRIGRWRRMLHRPTYNEYNLSETERRYVFFLSTLWYSDEWNQNDAGLNTRRANFIRACKQLPEVDFEGGLVSQGKERSSEALFSDCLAEAVSMKKWMENTKRSTLVFNTPAFWDCHGWKLGEYLAMGKCIASTALSNDLPVPLEHGVNVHFVENTLEDMKAAVAYMVNHPDYAAKLGQGAREYWEQYGTPEASLRLLGI